MKKLALRILMTYLLLLLLFTGAVVASCTIPRSAIEANLRQSVQQVTRDGQMFTWQVGFFKPYIIGVFTECLMLWVAGVILEVIMRNHWKQYEIMLMHHDMEHAIPHEPC